VHTGLREVPAPFLNDISTPRPRATVHLAFVTTGRSVSRPGLRRPVLTVVSQVVTVGDHTTRDAARQLEVVRRPGDTMNEMTMVNFTRLTIARN